jgi:ribosome maturation factor RimP
VKTELEVKVSEALTALGFELVELSVKGSKRRPVLDIRMDRIDGEKVTVNDCATVSRALEDRLVPLEPELGDYVLEVSSPGVERPLRRPEDWKRFTGRTVSVLSHLLNGRHELDLLGVEGERGSEVALFRDKRGSDIRVPLADIKEARLVFHWKR